jgi:hypothetical protein
MIRPIRVQKSLSNSKLILHEANHQIDLTIRKLPAKRCHSVSSFGNVSIDLLVRRVFEFALAQIWDSFSVIERLALAFRPMADRAILTKQRGFVSFAFGDHEPLLLITTARYRRGDDAECDRN